MTALPPNALILFIYMIFISLYMCDIMATECTQDSVLIFLMDNGGRVKNKDMVEHFKVFLNNDNTKKRALLKERFKGYVDNIAYVKQEDGGEKMVCLKKKYREMRRHEDLSGGINALEIEKISPKHKEIAGEMERSDEKMMMVVSDRCERTNVLCISDIALTEKSHLMSDSQENDKEGLHSSSQVIINRRRTSRGSQRSLLTADADAADAAADGMDGTPRGSRKTFLELMMSSSPQVRRSLLHRGSQEHIAARNGDIITDEDCACVTLDPLEHEWMMCAADGDWDALRRLLGCEPALILKKDFITGFTCLHWAAKQGKHELLAMLVNFAKQHDVAINVNARSSAGYTALHLAAMHNHMEVMKLLVGAFDVDVEVRDYSGRKAAQYLPATANGNIRDIIGACGNTDAENASGAGRWWLPKALPSNLNPLKLLNPPEDTTPDGPVKPRALYRKSSIGRIRLQRNRFKTQIVHSTSFRENDERDDLLKSPVKTRPMSNLFG